MNRAFLRAMKRLVWATAYEQQAGHAHAQQSKVRALDAVRAFYRDGCFPGGRVEAIANDHGWRRGLAVVEFRQ